MRAGLNPYMNRRELLALYAVPGLFAEQLARTPAVEEGPFYPHQLKLDTDNDLILLNNATTPAVGEVTYLTGRFLTGSTGYYNFRTIKPIPYRGRPAPHIHFKIKFKGQPDWTAQIYTKGHPDNERDGIYRRISADRDRVTLTFAPMPGATAGELAVPFDIVLPWR